jgi:hypothetical protein
MRITFWTWIALIVAAFAFPTYGILFDHNESLSHLLGTALVEIVLLLLALWLSTPVLRYIEKKNHKFTQEGVSDILAEAKRSGKQ